MRVICYIRRTKLWAEEYRYSDEWLRYWRADVLSNIWDTTFTIKYRDFRKRLNEIQKENLKEIPFDGIINQYEYQKGTDAIFIPVDDDDWFDINIVNILRDTAKPIVYWNFINYTEGSIIIQNPVKQKMQFIYESNNYALMRPNDEFLLKDHTYANRNLQQGLHIDENISIHNRSIASLGLLRKELLDKENPQQELLKLYDLYRKPFEMPEGITPYFYKYIDKMYKIYHNELNVRKVFL